MAYFLLGAAIASEIFATFLLKKSEGFSQLAPTIGCFAAYIVCYTAFSKAVTRINLGIAYATWCGVGIVVTSIISIFVFKEKIAFFGQIGMILIVIGCILVNLQYKS